MTENLEWREPQAAQAGDLWVKDGDIIMYIFTGHAWLPTQQTLKEHVATNKVVYEY